MTPSERPFEVDMISGLSLSHCLILSSPNQKPSHIYASAAIHYEGVIGMTDLVSFKRGVWAKPVLNHQDFRSQGKAHTTDRLHGRVERLTKLLSFSGMAACYVLS